MESRGGGSDDDAGRVDGMGWMLKLEIINGLIMNGKYGIGLSNGLQFLARPGHLES